MGVLSVVPKSGLHVDKILQILLQGVGVAMFNVGHLMVRILLSNQFPIARGRSASSSTDITGKQMSSLPVTLFISSESEAQTAKKNSRKINYRAIFGYLKTCLNENSI